MADEVKEDVQQIGRTSATERDPSSSDRFSFWLAPGVIANPFDIIEVDQVNQPGEPPSKTYGLITNIEHRTDAPSHLSNFISNNFGDLTEEPNTPRQGVSIAHINILSNDADIYMPVPNEAAVRFATKEGIERALGIDVLMKERPQDAIPAGLIKLSNGAVAVAYIDSRYVLGPESAHVNISGISGLVTKTSYAMFLLQAILQKTADPDSIAIIILNVKHGDLLQIEEKGENLSPEQKERWEAMGLKPEPFKNVHYLLPRSKDGKRPNSFVTPNMYSIYAYDLLNTADKLDLLFANIADPSNTMESIIGDIMTGLLGRESDFKNVQSWDNLLNGPPLFDPKAKTVERWRDHHKSSTGKFRRHLRRLVVTRQSGLFVNSLARHEKVLSDEIRKIKGGHIYVVDIAKLRDEEQTLVFGDLLRTIYEIKAEGAEDEKGNPIEAPEKVIFFVDELNKYAPAGARTSPITDQVLDIAERGRSLGVILLSAQQFMSAVHNRVTGNSATKILGRTGSAEVAMPDYRFLDDELKMSMTRLSQGELLVNHAIYRQPVKVIFPRAAYKQPTG